MDLVVGSWDVGCWMLMDGYGLFSDHWMFMDLRIFMASGSLVVIIRGQIQQHQMNAYPSYSVVHGIPFLCMAWLSIGFCCSWIDG